MLFLAAGFYLKNLNVLSPGMFNDVYSVKYLPINHVIQIETGFILFIHDKDFCWDADCYYCRTGICGK